MPPLKNQRHERFAFAVAGGMPAMQAYLEVGYGVGREGVSRGDPYENASGNASRIMGNNGVKQRVAEIRAKMMGKYVLSGRQVLERLTEVADGGRDALTVKSLELLGKHHELWNEGNRSVTINDFNRMSTAELLAIVRGEGTVIEGVPGSVGERPLLGTAHDVPSSAGLGTQDAGSPSATATPRDDTIG